jgi:hypothetical protein
MEGRLMPKIAYINKKISRARLEIIAQANQIIEAYQAQDLTLSLRQLYYRFVASDLIPNTQKAYSRLGSIINDGRLTGLIDWKAIEDRGRSLIERPHWDSPSDIIDSAARSYATDKWEGQLFHLEVWVEKQALEAVIDLAAQPLDVACYACKGYTSQSEMWRAAQRFQDIVNSGRHVVIIHLGDHDPSGIDMTRDIMDRINDTFDVAIAVDRIALNMNQVEQYNPPPNPAKLTDSRATGYIDAYGYESWELDALEPAVLNKLIQDTIMSYMDVPLFEEKKVQQEGERQQLLDVASNWTEVVGKFSGSNS